MRIAALVVTACLAGCGGVTTSAECQNDSQCGDDVCTRTGECLPRSSVRQLAVQWTVNGVAASATSCAAHPNLYLKFEGADYGDVFPVQPVACSAGKYNIDKLPRRYMQVELGFEGSTGEMSTIDAASTQIQFDLYE
jgi:hypothetical protein